MTQYLVAIHHPDDYLRCVLFTDGHGMQDRREQTDSGPGVFGRTYPARPSVMADPVNGSTRS